MALPTSQFRRRKQSWISWLRSPIFAAGLAVLLALAGYVAWSLANDFATPRRFVVVNTYALGESRVESGVRFEVVRLSIQPAFDIRLGPSLRDAAEERLWIDGTIANESNSDVLVFAPPDREGGEVEVRGSGRSWSGHVSMVAPRACPELSRGAAVLAPGERRRFSVAVPAGDAEWLLEAIEGGKLPQITFAGFATGDECRHDGTGRTWSYRFDPRTLPEVERQDLFPFGAPTAAEIGINGRRYWNFWVPRGS